MSIVIVGGNECMTHKYKELCSEYSCKAKVYPKMAREIQNMGKPDLLVLFTNTVSQKMIKCALSETRGNETRVVRSHSSSMQALKNILEKYTAGNM